MVRPMDASLLPNPAVEVRNARFGNALPLALIAGLLAVGFTVAGAAAADSYIFRRRNRVNEYA